MPASAAAPPARTPGARALSRAWAPVLTGGLALAAVAHLAVTDPYRPGSHLTCPILALTGWYCAGCGGQRAVHSLAHGDVAAAWAMNPLLVVLAPVAVVAWLRWLGRRARAGPRGAVRGTAGTRPPWVLLGVVVVFAVLRNVPLLAPWLAP